MPGPGGETFAFLDEFGDVNLRTDKAGVSLHFVIAAIIVPSDDVQRLRGAVNTVRDRHCQAGELRSQKLARRPERFRSVLHELCGTGFRFSALAVDKREVDRSSGLIYGQSFYKFLQRVLYQRLLSTYPRLQVITDAYGDAEFMFGFREYMMRAVGAQRSFFEDVTFVESRNDPLVQLADVVAGAVGRTLEGHPTRAKFIDLMDLIRPHALLVEEWPKRKLPTPDPRLGSLDDDVVVAQLALQRAVGFLSKHEEHADGEQLAQVRVLRKLLFESCYGEPATFTATGALQDHLATFGDRSDDQWLRSTVIAPLRDAGVIIASSAKGYRIPTSLNDLLSFVDHADRIIGPMARRLKAARDSVRMASHGKIDLVPADRYGVLAKAIDALDLFPAEDPGDEDLVE